MAWRRHKTHREETKAVKAALSAAGIKARVGHGTGTAWAWLDIRLAEPGNCKEALRIAQAVTGRHGKYDGDIEITTD